jgi:DeoR family fructose operon transcriptional repressor
MYPAERHAAILAAARAESGTVTVPQLSAELGVTAETVRRDLAVLERRGLVRRRRGGALLLARAPFEPTLHQRTLEDAAERTAIARAVVGRLPAEGVLLLDSGSMTLEVARLLAARSLEAPSSRAVRSRGEGRPAEAARASGPLVVVTNSLPVAALLRPRPGLTVYVLPGSVRSVTQAVVGPWAEDHLAELHADVAVLGANGVVAGAGAFTTLPEESAVKKGMLSAAAHRILAVTAPKFGTASLVRFAGLDRFDTVVTDGRLDAASADLVRADGPELVLTHP